MGQYLRPGDLAAATAALATRPFTILAGGTDFYPARVGRAVSEDLLDISGLADLRGISETPSHWRLGALLTWSGLIAAPLPRLFDGLKAAAREVGGRQIQNAGTLAGNLCNASPAADGTPNLLALEAEVELASRHGTRRLPVGAFVTGNRRTARRSDEMVTTILVPKPGGEWHGSFRKLGARRYLVISIVMAAAVLERSAAGPVGSARIAVGACSAVPQRLAGLERALAGRSWDATLADAVAPEHLAALSPISDVRGSADYRRAAARELVRDALRAIVAGP